MFLFHSEEDLYRAAEEIEQERQEKHTERQLSKAGIKEKNLFRNERLNTSNFMKAGEIYIPLIPVEDVVQCSFSAFVCYALKGHIFLYFLASVLNFEDQTSVSAPEGLLSYSQREWKGNTTKSHLIRKVQHLLYNGKSDSLH